MLTTALDLRALRSGLLLITALTLMFGCRPINVDSAIKVVNGTNTGLEPFKSVVRVSTPIKFTNREGKLVDGVASCTASIVGPRTVLTAAHCLHHDGKAATTASVTFDDGQVVGQGTPFLHTNFQRRTGRFDVALVHFDQDVFTSYEPIPIAMAAPTVGEGMAIVGYGKFDHYNERSGGVKRWGTNVVTGVDKEVKFRGSGSPVGDGDGKKVVNSQGDSGGPLLDTRGAIAGVSSAVSYAEGSTLGTGLYINLNDPPVKTWLQEHAGRNKIAGVTKGFDGIKVAFNEPLPSDPNIKPEDVTAPMPDVSEPITQDGIDQGDIPEGDKPVQILTNSYYGPCECRVADNSQGLGCTVYSVNGVPVLQAESDHACNDETLDAADRSRSCLRYYSLDLAPLCSNIE